MRRKRFVIINGEILVNYIRIVFAFFTTAIFLAAAAYAAVSPDINQLEKTRLLSVDVSMVESDLKQSSSFMDTKVKEVADVLARKGLKEAVFWASNYSVSLLKGANSCPDSRPCYRLTGYVTFKLLPPEGREQDLLDGLQKEGFSAKLSQYYFGQCQDN
jgi:hypothetical protein